VQQPERPLIPFFEGSLAQVRELRALCAEHDIATTPVEPPGGCGSG